VKLEKCSEAANFIPKIEFLPVFACGKLENQPLG